MRDYLKALRRRVLGPRRLAAGVWQVAEEVWGAVHDHKLAKLCIGGAYPEAERYAMERLARAAGQPEGARALALHDIACVYQVQGKFAYAVSAREHFRDLAREFFERARPGILAGYEPAVRGSDQTPLTPLPTEFLRPLYEIAIAEEVLADAYAGAGQADEALAGYEYALGVQKRIGDERAVKRIERSSAPLRQRQQLLSRLH